MCFSYSITQTNANISQTRVQKKVKIGSNLDITFHNYIIKNKKQYKKLKKTCFNCYLIKKEYDCVSSHNKPECGRSYHGYRALSAYHISLLHQC